MFDQSLLVPLARTTQRSSAFNNGLMGTLPPMVDHRADGTEGPVKHQGQVGACSVFSLSTAMDHQIRKMNKADVVSPLHIWAKSGGQGMGAQSVQAVGGAYAVEAVWPHDPVKACKLERRPNDHCGTAYGVTPGSAAADPEIRVDQARADALARYKLTRVEILDNSPADPDQVAAVLAGGDDIWVAFRYSREAWRHESVRCGVTCPSSSYTCCDRSVRVNAIPDYTIIDQDVPGHAVVLSGYRTRNGRREFLMHNSWGEDWGEGGYAWVSEFMIRQHMYVGYKVVVADTAGGGTSLPTQTGCPSGRVKDSVFGQCTAPCPSGSPPAAGLCLPTLQGQPPNPQTNNCPSGQARDAMTGACTPLCPGGYPTIGGMCLPIGPRR